MRAWCTPRSGYGPFAISQIILIFASNQSFGFCVLITVPIAKASATFSKDDGIFAFS
ncbi:hypothetical protein K443DRAFT_111220 [Laccaria amethystina LaAM-08-1]|jgi:hypothetical protein|uniref:Uncharacterized protein n=1 Tax=Laccaria amethystina LaAM-08-1 TaxID=1095629 RepID=A0A0C9WYJ9_9AGAR|nr:hypothetical protein K443DRAFT_111220 [Laccaria amethystina LaAM-08-1]